MSKSWSILHISDFHIHDPDGSEELLRADHYDEYLNDLVVAARKVHAAPINGLVVSGDFVNYGITGNFAHAERIIHFIAGELKIPNEAIVVCPGNHDVEKAKENDRTFEAARE